jgi:hypothetical protein
VYVCERERVRFEESLRLKAVHLCAFKPKIGVWCVEHASGGVARREIVLMVVWLEDRLAEMRCCKMYIVERRV